MSATEISLTNPVEIGGKLVSSISIRPPTDEDLAAVSLLNVSKSVRGLRLCERLTGESRETLRATSLADQAKISAFLATYGVV